MSSFLLSEPVNHSSGLHLKGNLQVGIMVDYFIMSINITSINLDLIDKPSPQHYFFFMDLSYFVILDVPKEANLSS